MRSSLRTLTLLLGLVTMGRHVLASEPSSVPAQSRKAPAHETGKASPKPAPPTSPPNAPPAAPATAATAPPPARQETLDEIVARVRRRLATETPRHAPRPVAPRPPVVERVKLVWRPAVVWPSELVSGGQASSAPVVDPNRAAPTRDSH